MRPYALGVDLGTTYSAAAIARGHAVEPLPLGSDAAQMPSVVVIREDGEVLVGDAAERRAAAEPLRAAREFKRRLGDPVPIVVGGSPHTVESLMGHLLADVVARATAQEGGPPTTVVLTHPANYTAFKTGLLRDAARLAGLSDARVVLLTEPEAAAIAYGRQQRIEVGDVVAVYDFGGGTFDAAVVRRNGNQFELVGVPEGMERLGGIDIDQAVLAHVDATLGGRVAAADPRDPGTRPGQARLRAECRRAKEALSTDTDTTVSVSLPGVVADVPLTRDALEAMIGPRIADTVRSLQRAVASAGLDMDRVTRVLLVGGTSRMPVVGRAVAQATGRPVSRDAHPKLAIALGAAAAGAATLPADDTPADPAWRPPTPAGAPTAPARSTRTAADAGSPTGRRRAGKGTIIGAVGAGLGVAAVLVALALRGGSSHGTAAGTTTTTAAAGALTAGATTTAAGSTVPTPATAAGVVEAFAFGGPVAGQGIPGPAQAAGVSAIDALAVGPGGVLVAADSTLLTVSEGRVSTAGRVDGPVGGLASAPDGAVYASTPIGVIRFTGGTASVLLAGADAGLGATAGPLATDGAGNVYVADNANHRIVRRAADGALSLVAGNGTAPTRASAPGEGQRAETVALGTVSGLAVDGKGNLVVADDGALTVRVVSRAGTITTLAGAGSTPVIGAGTPVADGTPGRNLAFASLGGLAVDGQGRVYVADRDGGLVLRIAADGATTVVIARRPGTRPADGVPAKASSLTAVGALAFDPRTGTLYLQDGAVVRRITGLG